MPLYSDDNRPPADKLVEWEVNIPGNCVWTVMVQAITPEEAVALAVKKLEDDTSIEPDDNPEPEYSDAEIVAWEPIKEAPEAA
jgi:hypothetical protein